MLLVGSGPNFSPLPCHQRGLGVMLNYGLLGFMYRFLQSGRPALPLKWGGRPRERVISGMGDTIERGFILQDAQHTAIENEAPLPRRGKQLLLVLKPFWAGR